MSRRRNLAIAGVAAGAAVAAATTVAVRRAGRSIAQRSDADLDALLEAPSGVRHHQIPTEDGGSLHVAEYGSGRPVVLLHGVTLQWWVWAPLFHLLGTDHRVLAWDMRGHGRSEPGADGVTLEAIATDLSRLLHHFECSDAVVVGHSMGGMALGRFCLDHPHAHDRVGHLVFLATSAAVLRPLVVVPGSLLERSLMGAASAGMGRRRYQWNDSALSRVLVRTAFGRHATAKAVDDVRRMLVEMDPQHLVDAGRSIATHDVTAELAAVDLPTTVVTGTRDTLTPPRHARALAAVVGHSTLHLLDGVGHQVMQEVPEELALILRGVSERAGHEHPHPAAAVN